jgi:hypothetical protein
MVLSQGNLVATEFVMHHIVEPPNPNPTTTAPISRRTLLESSAGAGLAPQLLAGTVPPWVRAMRTPLTPRRVSDQHAR